VVTSAGFVRFARDVNNEFGVRLRHVTVQIFKASRVRQVDLIEGTDSTQENQEQ
jgi:hypothetical protein